MVKGSVEGYRLAYPDTAFTLEVEAGGFPVEGSPDLAAQMLDKLVDNAVSFAAAGTPVEVRLERAGTRATLTVSNRGPRLPPDLRGRLFDAMVGSRPGGTPGAPHLGLGLYVTRLVAEFHGGTVEAADLPDGSGVRFSVRLPLAQEPTI